MHKTGIHIVAAALGLGLLAAACSSGGSAEESGSDPRIAEQEATIEEQAATISDQAGRIEALEAEVAANQATIEELQTQQADTEAAHEAALDGAVADAEDAVAEVEVVEKELEALRQAFDAEFVAARMEFTAAFPDLACAWIAENPGDSASTEELATAVAQGNSQWSLALDVTALRDVANVPAVAAAVDDCRSAAEDQAKAAAALERMTSDKRDGFYTVGVEIAPGTWESTGSGDDCYWERLDADQEILDNHFGNAGGRVKIRASDDQFHSSDCGSWVYQGG